MADGARAGRTASEEAAYLAEHMRKVAEEVPKRAIALLEPHIAENEHVYLVFHKMHGQYAWMRQMAVRLDALAQTIEAEQRASRPGDAEPVATEADQPTEVSRDAILRVPLDRPGGSLGPDGEGGG